MRFKNNRNPSVEILHQMQTYFGLYEGVPTTKLNRTYIDIAKQRAQSLFPDLPIYLVPPVEKKQTTPSGSEYALLPSVTCFAYLSDAPIDREMECSRLCAIWYQSAYAFPIDAQILEYFSEVDWESVSEDSWNL